MAYHFSQPCPACGRQLRIAVQLLGREVGCQHCGCQFRAGCDSADDSDPEMSVPLLERVDEILRRTERPRDMTGLSERV
jgi:hypothetical protein